MNPTLLEFDWQVSPMERAQTLPLAKALGVAPLLAHLLYQRGVDSIDAGRRFMTAGLGATSDPFSLTGMSSLVARLTEARDRDEHILVFGDYDVDGISGTAAMVEALRRFGLQHVDWDLPERETGYGLDAERVSRAHEDGVDLIITVDNGITAFEAAEKARELGVELIITDHHSPAETLPPAHTIVNPRLEREDHPAANLSGSALAYKTALALTGAHDELDLACLGLVADLMPLKGEVRDLVTAGLRAIQNRPRVGLMELARVSRTTIERLTSENIAFQLGPRLNAAGRLGDPRIALELLLTEDPAVASAHARTLDRANLERREIEKRIFEEALAMLEGGIPDNQHSIVLQSGEWHHGVIGIVAAKLQRRFHRPVVLIAFENGVGRGSGRSMRGCNLVDILTACAGYLDKFGGHAAAAGLTIGRDKYDAFRQAFEEAAAARMDDAPQAAPLRIDAQVSLSEVDHPLLQLIEQLQPFGHGNPSPVFCTYGAEMLQNSVTEVRGGHLRFSVKEGPRVFTAMAFSMAEWMEPLRTAKRVDIAFAPALNEWNGKTTIQLVIQDLRILN